MTNQALLTSETLNSLCPDCKAIIAAQLGLGGQADPVAAVADDGEEYAELGLQAARVFLIGCNPKTRLALQLILASGERFSLRTLEGEMQVAEGGLRGVWTGLTKRTRTVTGDPDAVLIRWSDETDEGDYIGELMPTTRDALQRALAEAAD